MLFFLLVFSLLKLRLTLQDILRPNFSWSSLFDPFPHAKTYALFVKIRLSSSDHDSLGQWTGWVKSRFRSLLVKVHVSC